MSTFSQITIHIVFAVKFRRPLIHPSWEDQLYKYITGIIQNKGQKLLAINGVPDHIHILIEMKPSCCLSELVREVKKSSNNFINENNLSPSKFSWQEGFGAFSHCRSSIHKICNYIADQKAWHKNKNSKEEFIEILEKLKVKFQYEHIL